jgi:predicted DNA-binding transcriptional regulator AlpA
LRRNSRCEGCGFLFIGTKESLIAKKKKNMFINELTFDRLPEAMGYLIGKVEALEKALQVKNEQPTTPAVRWLNIEELKDYLPDRPAKATIYGWVSAKKIPNHKGGKKLRFLQSEIDSWLSAEKRKSEHEMEVEASEYLNKKKGVKRYE